MRTRESMESYFIFLFFRSSSLGRFHPGGCVCQQNRECQQQQSRMHGWLAGCDRQNVLANLKHSYCSTISMPRKYLLNGMRGFPTLERSRRRGMQSCRVARHHGKQCVYPSSPLWFLLPLLICVYTCSLLAMGRESDWYPRCIPSLQHCQAQD